MPKFWESRGLENSTFLPSKNIDPTLCLNKPDNTFINVDFPAPLSPTIPKTSPGRSLRFAFSSAVIVPKYFEIPLASRMISEELEIMYGTIKEKIT